MTERLQTPGAVPLTSGVAAPERRAGAEPLSDAPLQRDAFVSLCAAVDLLREGHSTAALNTLERAYSAQIAGRAAELPAPVAAALERLIDSAKRTRGVAAATILVALRGVDAQGLRELTAGQAVVLAERLAVALEQLKGGA